MGISLIGRVCPGKPSYNARCRARAAAAQRPGPFGGMPCASLRARREPLIRYVPFVPQLNRRYAALGLISTL